MQINRNGGRARRIARVARRQSAGWLGAIACLVGLAAILPLAAQAFAGQPAAAPSETASAAVPIAAAEYHSRHFLVHTDLPAAEARSLLDRLEETLAIVVKYWGKPSRGVIECWVVQNSDGWSDAALGHPLARLILKQVGGATMVLSEKRNGVTRRKAAVYAVATRGVAEHEAVHAYASQTFGTAGPDWYKEGMAQMAYYHRAGGNGVACPKELVAALQRSPARTVGEITAGGSFTAPMVDSFTEILARRGTGRGEGESVPIHFWTSAHAEQLKTARQSYDWSWALCHMLCHNSNYSDRFRTWGKALLADHGATFEEAFRPVAREADFEFRFFREHFSPGYRVDLCRWDWSRKFHPVVGHEQASATISAARGYQASGVRVFSGKQYAYAAPGTWTVRPAGKATSADGAAGGHGRLVGVVMNGFELGRPFALGSRGAFTAPGDGNLYLRCQDAWDELSDNEGAITVRLERKL
ncbi:MAG: hypothetical protein ACYC35_24130 [Pirellulales bacterium]